MVVVTAEKTLIAEDIEAKSVSEVVSKVIRTVTVPPVIAFAMLTYFYFGTTGVFSSPGEYGLSVFFICILPALAYPVQLILKNKFPGRDGQRTLAMFFSVAGYILGAATAFLTDSPQTLKLIYLGYLISGALILILSKCAEFKISGHAVGSAGPIAILLGFGQWVWVFGLPVILSVFYSSLKIKRHTKTQIICGLIQPFIVFSLLTGWCGI